MQGAVEIPVNSLQGVGVAKAALLERLNIRTVRDLLLHRPRRHEDRREIRPIASLQEGETATARGTIAAAGLKTWQRGRRSLFECIIDDGTGRLHCRWWNLPFLQHQFHTGERLFVHGKVSALRPRAMDHPETEHEQPGDEPSIHLQRIVPIYSLTEGLTQRWLRSLVFHALEAHSGSFQFDFETPSSADRTPAQLLKDLHFPETTDAPEQARRQLALFELTAFQQEIHRRRQRFVSHAAGRPCPGDNRLIRPFLKELGFKLTEAQTRVLRDIRADLGKPVPMRRLLQGDVGSGKTVVAGCAALMAIESGCNAVLMAPTEILAAQHAVTFRRWFSPLGIPVRLVTGTQKNTDAPAPAASPVTETSARSLAPGLVVGTHALIQDRFTIDRLGLAIIDEQHKFGVAQREQLVRKGRYPHLLIMTATPIPRTLGLTLYGDLDASVIDALPPGRGCVKTHLRAVGDLPKVHAFVRKLLDQGRQAYFVFPRVDEDAGNTLKTVTAEYRALSSVLASHKVGMVHGQLAAAERDRVMTAFHRGELAALVASSVIEVGVDVANATVMVVAHAERFGLAQLHQLRGRIGRGSQQSHCILVADLRQPDARQRLEILAGTNDGFQIAEADLQLRGPGEFLGRSQSGLPPFQFADLRTDLDLVEEARKRVRSRECVGKPEKPA
jgi:ATP-dependent DNA helicase RecG